MKLKRTLIVAIIGVFFASCFALVADPINGIEEGRAQETFEFIPDEVHVVETTEAVTGKGNGGPEVVEYYEYKEDKAPAKPGSLSDQYDFATIGKGLFYDGTDFYYFTDTGIVASNFMKTIEGDRFFFGEDGKMVKGQLVNFEDELYYFDVNGAMYKNRWYTHEEIDDVDNTITYTDYYFGPTGRAYRASDNGNNLIVKTIEEEKYGFNSEGEKLEGYYNYDGTEYDPAEDPAYIGCTYYFDPKENGAAITGWHYYEGATRSSEYDDDEELVMYFDPKTARKVAAKPSGGLERCISRIIEGQRYMFDENGIRRNKWYRSEVGRGATISNAKFFSEEYDGYLQKGWFTAVPGAYNKNGTDLILDVNKKRHEEEEECWFYAGSNGNVLRKTIRKIGKYTYAFDDDGVMQQNAMVKVKNGEFIKAYDCDLITKANVLCDPKEYGDAERDHDRSATSNPIDLPKEEGLLHLDEGERWMFFLNEDNDITAGSKCRENVLVKIELADDIIDFYCNSVGGYFKEGLTDPDPDPTINSVSISVPVERSNKYIQNGVVLKPNPDDNNYGLMRYIPSKQGFGDYVTEHNKILNWRNKKIDLSSLTRRIYYVVNASGNIYKGEYKSFKDKQGDWIWVGYNGEFLGCFSYQGKFEQFKASNDVPYIDVNENGDKAQEGDTVVHRINSGDWYWKYKKDGARDYSYGMPAKEQRINCKDLALNYNGSSKISGTPGDPDADFGPYKDGLAALVYEN